MLLTIVGALTTATVVVVTAELLRERRALAADVRALRKELRHLAGAIAAGREAANAAGASAEEVTCGDDVEAAATRRGSVSGQTARGPRTIH